MFVLGAVVLSGTLAALPETKGMVKLAACLMAAAAVLMAYRKGKGSRLTLLFCALSFFLFSASFLRAKSVSRELSSEEYQAFFEKYEASNPGEFDYSLYLKGLNVRTEEERKALKDPEASMGNVLTDRLQKFRVFCGTVLSSLMTEHDAGIYQAMILGDKTGMDEGVKGLYQESGISHLLAVSGLHVSLIGMGAYKFLREKLCLSGMTSSLSASILTFLYVLFTGASGSALRAFFMLSLSIFAVQCGRTYDSFTGLSLSCILLLFYRPYLVLQSGFQLSFLAITGICGSAGLLDKGVFSEKKETETNEKQNHFLKTLKTSFLSSFCVTLCTLPVIASAYYSFPLYSVFLNILVIPLMSAVMISGLCALFIGILSASVSAAGFPLFSQITGRIARLSVSPGHYILKLYELLCRAVMRVPSATIVTGKPLPIRWILYAGLLYFLYLVLRKDIRIPEIIPVGKAGALVLSSLSVILLFAPKEKGFYVECLDVGQGDCFHIHNGDIDILMDGGSQGYEKVGSNVIESYLLSKRIKELDLVTVSHADADHVNGLYYLLSEESAVTVNALMLPKAAEKDEKYDRLRESFSKPERIYLAEEGSGFGKGTMKLQCLLSRDASEVSDDTNRQSSVYLLLNNGFSMLFCGDITEKEEKLLMEKYDETGVISNLCVLKAAHHGSKTASSEGFIAFTDPQYAVLSYKKGNSYGHPDKEVVDRLEERNVSLLRTAELGAVKITWKNGTVYSSGFSEGRRSGIHKE